MKNQITLTATQQEALNLINESTADIWSHPKGVRGGKDEHENLCEYCGKHSKDGKGEYFQILTSGLIVPNKISQDTIWELYRLGAIKDQPQGCFPIGSTCAKKLLGSKVSLYLEYSK